MKQAAFILILLILIGCKIDPKYQTNSKDKLKVLATTGILYDAIINIGDTLIEPDYIMGPGVDPHLYKATQGDLKKLKEADVIIYNGHMLEGKMAEILKKLSKQKMVISAAEHIPDSLLLQLSSHAGSYDPHVWFDVSKWKIVINSINESLSTADSSNAIFYSLYTNNYLKKLDSLEKYIVKRTSEIPSDKRILITAHDAFEYFGNAYGFEVKGLQGISTVSDFGLKDITQLIDLIVEKEIKAIFIETSVSDRSIKSVVEGCKKKGHEVSIGGSLYSDALGEIGTLEGTYIGAFKKNIDTIIDSLK